MNDSSVLTYIRSVLSRKRIVIGIGELAIPAEPESVIVTHALGSCVAVCLWDPTARVGGMIHVLLRIEINPTRAERKTRRVCRHRDSVACPHGVSVRGREAALPRADDWRRLDSGRPAGRAVRWASATRSRSASCCGERCAYRAGSGGRDLGLQRDPRPVGWFGQLSGASWRPRSAKEWTQRPCRLRFLIVDDSCDHACPHQACAAPLSGANVIIAEASNGREALTVLETERIDIVFTDLNMPVMTGTELLREMARREWHNIKRRVVSTDGSHARREEVKDLLVTRDPSNSLPRRCSPMSSLKSAQRTLPSELNDLLVAAITQVCETSFFAFTEAALPNLRRARPTNRAGSTAW